MRDFSNEEHEFFKENRKEGKIERKRFIAKDRSKYKKTDQEKYLKSLEEEKAAKLKKGSKEGRVLSITPQGIIVDCEKSLFVCALKGLLKKDKTQFKNLVAVGDLVFFEETARGEGVISQITPRKTILSRADNLSRRKEQLIAVNVDQVIITVSVVEPTLKSSIIDRYIIAAQKGGMEPIVVINKIDLLQSGEEESFNVEVESVLYLEALKAYEQAGIPIIGVSVKEGLGLDALKAKMRDKTSVFSGQSGVGKSSLINAVAEVNLKTGEVVERTKKGSHTTTTTSLLPLPFGGFCVDTPGIKSFGVWNLTRDEVEAYFPEIHEIGLGCKFADCTHTQEASCAVQKALEEGLLSPLRFESYLALCESLSEMHRRR